MANYVFTDSMKRHERAQVCKKLYKEMIQTRWLNRTLVPIQVTIDIKIRNENKHKGSRERIYTIKSITYHGVPIYIIVYKDKSCHVVFNTSPVDAAYTEFVIVADALSTTTTIYTQHALDRYNERIHKKKYQNHRELMQRLMLNSYPMPDAINVDNEIVVRTNEGFLCGKYDAVHRNIICNTFYDNEELMDNKRQKMARQLTGLLGTLTPQQMAIYRTLLTQSDHNIITKDEMYQQLVRHGILGG